jgi:hypothetical protein
MRKVGIEWEVNDYFGNIRRRDHAKAIAGKRILEAELRKRCKLPLGLDGSCGFEIRTRPISSNKTLRKVLQNIGTSINRSGLTVKSDCGIHVHVDARDLLDIDVLRIGKVYAHIEMQLYKFAGMSRYDNEYCVPNGSTFRALTDCRLLSAFAERYSGLNITNWTARYRNKLTLEFRMHRGVKDWKRVYRWANICRAIVEFGKRENALQLLPRSPIRRDGKPILYGVHNGMIYGTEETAAERGRKFLVDSKEFFELLVDNELDTIRSLAGYGVAMWMTPKHPKKVSLLRLSMLSEICVVSLVEGGMAWASTPLILKRALNSAGLRVYQEFDLPTVGRLYQIYDDECKYKKSLPKLSLRG